jgi:16S rRNA (cytosine967-C5)-methyltransferase
VADICAGAGGKTLAFAASMQNTGQIHAYDADATRFRPIFERLKRAGARNVQTLPPGQEQALAALAGRMDLVLIDAPCSGTGVWRRHPDAKWRLKPAQLGERQETQRSLLAAGASLLKPGGVLAYVTCSVLPEENAHQVQAFLQANGGFTKADLSAASANVLSAPLTSAINPAHPGLQLTPFRHGTDGFYIALMAKTG